MQLNGLRETVLACVMHNAMEQVQEQVRQLHQTCALVRQGRHTPGMALPQAWATAFELKTYVETMDCLALDRSGEMSRVGQQVQAMFDRVRQYERGCLEHTLPCAAVGFEDVLPESLLSGLREMTDELAGRYSRSLEPSDSAVADGIPMVAMAA